jgi:hypothetical protein
LEGEDGVGGVAVSFVLRRVGLVVEARGEGLCRLHGLEMVTGEEEAIGGTYDDPFAV